jgi:hypothetical protein
MPHLCSSRPKMSSTCFRHEGVHSSSRCNMDLQREDGCTALFIAAHNGHADVTKQLIEARLTLIGRPIMGPHRSSSLPKKGMCLSRTCSFKFAVIWIFRGRMDRHRSSSRPQDDHVPENVKERQRASGQDASACCCPRVEEVE